MFKRFPQWKQYSGYRVTGEPDDIAYWLDVHVPPVNPNVSEPLKITTYPKEVLVTWIKGVHRHFDTFFPRPHSPDYMEQAIEMLEEVVTDKIVFGYWEQDGKPTGGGIYFSLTADSPSKMPSTEHGSVIIRSWLGGQDREIHP
ncbi:MAG: hypothetical protein H7308_08180 [Chthonomonadaceae bacterium]|nr:hypothetical protein [Chthonomonadaceae bacterium]